jgi:hypothetical protein
MSIMIDDATIATILRCIATGALAAVLLIIFVLPGLLAAFDRFVVGKQGQEKTCGETIQPDKPINK